MRSHNYRCPDDDVMYLNFEKIHLYIIDIETLRSPDGFVIFDFQSNFSPGMRRNNPGLVLQVDYVQVLVKDETLKVKASELAEKKEVILSSFVNVFLSPNKLVIFLNIFPSYCCLLNL